MATITDLLATCPWPAGVDKPNGMRLADLGGGVYQVTVARPGIWVILRGAPLVTLRRAVEYWLAVKRRIGAAHPDRVAIRNWNPGYTLAQVEAAQTTDAQWMAASTAFSWANRVVVLLEVEGIRRRLRNALAEVVDVDSLAGAKFVLLCGSGIRQEALDDIADIAARENVVAVSLAADSELRAEVLT